MGNSGVDRDAVAAAKRLLLFLQQHFGIFAAAAADIVPAEGLNARDIPLSAFELVDDDKPVVVPYEEVVKVLGRAADDETAETDETAMAVDDEGAAAARHPASHVVPANSGSSSGSSSAQAERGPSAAAQRWQRMGEMLDQVPTTLPKPPPPPVLRGGSSSQQQQQQQQRKQLYSQRLVEAYPHLFAAVDPGEDVVMAAARLEVNPRSQTLHACISGACAKHPEQHRSTTLIFAFKCTCAF
eukprot:TRINITY_DN904_c0_g1_i3.p2 TRINITY_DN904_c0_g1~~TRINITY_DN904_c0_g1_i3.p2  ORF type:complete len:241 (-),score=112.29 TRINITY_DN904_c0_g1_i3:47-769(-)